MFRIRKVAICMTATWDKNWSGNMRQQVQEQVNMSLTCSRIIIFILKCQKTQWQNAPKLGVGQGNEEVSPTTVSANTAWNLGLGSTHVPVASHRTSTQHSISGILLNSAFTYVHNHHNQPTRKNRTAPETRFRKDVLGDCVDSLATVFARRKRRHLVRLDGSGSLIRIWYNRKHDYLVRLVWIIGQVG